ncbi:MAG: hypothetical protein C3F06_02475 [Candidatus Methanoperedenaceae archaeon]|nr:MAG: hypothetical protein C3F06_02475 [Candidatus Methanoperedenaceae archaeon]
MGLFKFLPFNTLRIIYNDLSDASKEKKAREDAMKEAGLDPQNYWNWSIEDHEKERAIGKRLFKERGIKREW